jgi:hypothetical protein
MGANGVSATQLSEPITAATAPFRPALAAPVHRQSPDDVIVYVLPRSSNLNPRSIATIEGGLVSLGGPNANSVVLNRHFQVERVSPPDIALGQWTFSLPSTVHIGDLAYYSLDPGAFVQTPRLDGSMHAQFEAFESQLQSFAKLPRDWDGHDSVAPNGVAVASCRSVLKLAQNLQFPPNRLLVASESVFAYFANGDKYADVECENDGSIMIVLSDRIAGPKAWATSSEGLAEDLPRIRAFLL